MSRVLLALAIKDLRLLVRDRAGAFLTFAWPLIVAIFFGALGPIGGKPSSAVEVALVDEDQSAASRDFISRVETTGNVEFVAMPPAQARERVEQGLLTAFIIIPEGFAEAHAHNTKVAPAQLELGVDPRRRAEAGMLQGLLIEHAFGGLDSVQPIELEVTEIRRQSAVEEPPSPYTVTFTQGIIWAVIACAATFGVSLVNERQQGTLLRLCVAPIGRRYVLAGKALACMTAIVIVSLALLAIAVLGFDVRPNSWPLVAMAIAGLAVGFVGLMMLLAVIGRTAQSAAGLSWAVLMVLAMLGGGMLPLFMMPEWLQNLALASPVSWGLLALEGAIWRGWSLQEMLVPTGALVGLGIVSFAFGARSFRYH